MMRPWALVTGASSGIGLELARLAAADGHDLVLVARGAQRLEAVARELRALGGQVHAWPLDLAAAGGADRLADILAAHAIQPQLLFNNAGVGAYGLYRDVAPEADQQIIDLNIVALTRLTRRLLPGMLAAGRGRILNVASTAAFQPGPYMAVYYATKAYVLHYSEALAFELRGTGVTVTALCPGPTPSGFQAASGMNASRLVRGLVPMTSCASVARGGYLALLAGRPVVIPGALNWLLAQSVRLVPRRLATAFVAFVSRPA